jgi:hypothetical protein
VRFSLVSIFIFFVFAGYGQSQDLSVSHSYYINLNSDTAYGLVKLNRGGRHFHFVKNGKWSTETVPVSTVRKVKKQKHSYIPLYYNNSFQLVEKHSINTALLDRFVIKPEHHFVYTSFAKEDKITSLPALLSSKYLLDNNASWIKTASSELKTYWERE